MATARELRAIEEACRALKAGDAFLRRTLRPGLSEREVARALGGFFRRRGYPKRAFPFIIAAGSAAAEPHHVPTNRRLRRGDMVKCDFGIRIRNTASDFTRTYILGTPSPRLRRIYQAVRSAQQLAVGHLKPGASGNALDARARNALRRRGYGKDFIHALGHGVGFQIHQPPWLSPRKHSRLSVGDVITVEPGVYQRGWGGVRIEDMYLITERGARHLTQVPSDLRSAIIRL